LALDPSLVPQPPSRNSQSRSMSMSNSSERAAGTQSPTQLAQRWARDPKQSGGPAAVQPANSVASRADDDNDDDDLDRPFPLRAMRSPPELPPPASTARSFGKTVRDFALVALVSMASAFLAITIYTRMPAGDATSTPAAAPARLQAPRLRPMSPRPPRLPPPLPPPQLPPLPLPPPHRRRPRRLPSSRRARPALPSAA
jgi:hypothetical protein